VVKEAMDVAVVVLVVLQIGRTRGNLDEQNVSAAGKFERGRKRSTGNWEQTVASTWPKRIEPRTVRAPMLVKEGMLRCFLSGESFCLWLKEQKPSYIHEFLSQEITQKVRLDRCPSEYWCTSMSLDFRQAS